MQRIPYFLLLLWIAGCTDSPGERGAVVTRDSAGIEIVEATAPAWTAGQEWRIGATPTLSIGEAEGDSAYLFNGIAGAHRFADGSLVVADGGSNEIRFYGADGKHRGTAGRRGAGPGEFEFMGRMWVRAGDSIAVTDRKGISFLDPAGRFARLLTLQRGEDKYRVNPAGELQNGSFLTVSGTRGMRWEDAGTLIQDTMRFYRYQPDGSFAALLTLVPAAPRWGLRAGGIVSFPFVPFGANPVWAVGRDGLYVGSGQGAELRVWNEDGKLRRIMRWPRTPTPVSPEVRDAYRSELLESAREPNDRRRYEVFLSEVPLPSQLPTYQSLLLDHDQNAWLERYRPSNKAPSEWDIVTAAGRWLGTLNLPTGLTPLQIGADFVLAVVRDEFGVERIQLFQFSRR